MNFLSKTFNTLTGNSIPYTFNEKIVDPTTQSTKLDQNSIWTIYNGINPKDNSLISIFEFQLNNPKTSQYINLAKNAFKKLKTIKYPGIISIIEFLELNDTLYIITERVIPLPTYLETNPNLSKDSIIAGIYSISNTLNFLNEECNLLYGGLNFYNSIFINLQNDWKLMGFELITNLISDPDQPIYRLNQYSPSQKDIIDIENLRKDPKKYDSFKLGNFIFEVFNNGNLDLNFKIPTRLIGPSKRLIAKRNYISSFLKEMDPIFKQNKVINFNNLLNELKFMNNDQKLEFFKFELLKFIDNDNDEEDTTYPPGMLNYKLLPELITQFNQLKTQPISSDPQQQQANQEIISIILNFIIKFGIQLPTEEFNKQIKPIIFESFILPDRSIRLILLNHLPSYEKFLNDSDIQYKIFNPLITGFQDTNFMIRETTLKSITIIIDKISIKQINNELLRILAKTQIDPKPSIRVNTLILIITISSKIYKNSKNNVLITALSKSLRDSFIPCKMTALNGFKTLINEFTLEEICSKILGHLAISLMDKKSNKVRKESKLVFDLYLKNVENFADELSDNEDEEDEDKEEKEFFKKYSSTQQQPNGSGQVSTESTESSFGWNMMSKLTSIGTTNNAGQLNKDFNQSTPDITRVSTPSQKQLPLHKQSNSKSNLKLDDEINEDDDGWDNDDQLEEDYFNDDWIDNSEEVSKDEKTTNLSNNFPIIENTKKLNLGKSTHTINLRNTPTTTITTTRKPLSLGTTTKKPITKSSLKLGSKQNNKPKSTLKLNLTVDDDKEEDGWGDGW
ncbi:CEX1 [Candida pseudojiufengensis]|uniref:CEX1 n=1 Tax=Candida pseudojiufengensis TaxID=497109 RepID=UPI00222457E9|nr:CEX1 [Candida pseudojiufengensis]KAI5963505.1 CEX1 [Candida pseudojiufengensis]